ncbi:hypothetical protein N9M08_07965 [Porticoccaceae bacterium]|nr:hypothetical protein [Porticoccaceae bacterium]MDB2634832.1 hypothetical protein [Porticoccaceae bacterium]
MSLLQIILELKLAYSWSLAFYLIEVWRQQPRADYMPLVIALKWFTAKLVLVSSGAGRASINCLCKRLPAEKNLGKL